MKMHHAELIAYAAQHPDGWASLEWANNSFTFSAGSVGVNPVALREFVWRKKTATLRINVEIPKPHFDNESKFPLIIGGRCAGFYTTNEEREKAEAILIAAFRGTS